MATLGQIAYETWSSLLHIPSPITWEDLPQTAQDGWEMVAQIVIDENMRKKSIANSTQPYGLA